MAIRIRAINGITVALCAAETDALPGDVYLDDAAHHALSTKMGLDWQSMGFIADPPIDKEVAAVMVTQKIRNAEDNLREWMADQSGINSNSPQAT